MSKIIIFFISLFLINNANANSFSLGKDIGSGNSYTKSLESGFKKHGVKIVKKENGFPVRSGEESVRFEVRFGDCGKDKPPGKWNDCKKDRQRHELSGKKFKGKKWVAFSIYLPEDFESVDPVKLAMGQFHQKGGSPNLMFQFNKYGYYVDRQLSFMTQEMKKILDVEEMIGKWNDILINGNFTKKEDGFFKVWVNNELKYEYYGRTTSGKPSYFKFGIYQTYVSRYPTSETNPYPTQIVFFDEIRHGSTKEAVVKNLY